MKTKEIDVFETKTYLSDLAAILYKGQDESILREGIKEIIRKDPVVGDIIPKSGGVRKFRYATPGKGKSGGYRVIYYFYAKPHPAFLLTIYSKSKTENLTPVAVQKLYDFAKQVKVRLQNKR